MEKKIWTSVVTKVFDLSTSALEVKQSAEAFSTKELAIKWGASQAAQALYDIRLTREAHSDGFPFVHRISEDGKRLELPDPEEAKQDAFCVPSFDTYEGFCEDLKTDKAKAFEDEDNPREGTQPPDFADIKLLPMQPPYVPENVPLKDIWPQVKKGLEARCFLQQKVSERVMEMRHARRKRKREPQED